MIRRVAGAVADVCWRVSTRAVQLLHVSPSARRARESRANPCASCHRRLMSNQRKNGPPMTAVMMPTGSSSGANTVRASASHATRNARAEERRRRQHEPMVGADDQPHQVRHDDADEADRAADRHRRAGGERRAEERDALRAHDVDAARRRRLGAEAEQIERPREPRERRRTRRRRTAAPRGSARSSRRRDRPSASAARDTSRRSR